MRREGWLSGCIGILAGLLLLNPSASAAQAIYAANQKPANGVEIEYEIRIDDPSSHIYTVEINIRGVEDQTLQLAMPAWAPGDHRIRDFARNVQNFQVRTRSGGDHSIGTRQTSKRGRS